MINKTDIQEINSIRSEIDNAKCKLRNKGDKLRNFLTFNKGLLPSCHNTGAGIFIEYFGYANFNVVFIYKHDILEDLVITQTDIKYDN